MNLLFTLAKTESFLDNAQWMGSGPCTRDGVFLQCSSEAMVGCRDISQHTEAWFFHQQLIQPIKVVLH